MITEITCLTCLTDDATMYIVDDLDELRGVWCATCDRITWGDEIREYNSTVEVTSAASINSWLKDLRELGATTDFPEALRP